MSITPKQARHIRHMVGAIIQTRKVSNYVAGITLEVLVERWKLYILIESGFVDMESGAEQEIGRAEAIALLDYSRDCALNVHHLTLEETHALFPDEALFSSKYDEDVAAGEEAARQSEEIANAGHKTVVITQSDASDVVADEHPGGGYPESYPSGRHYTGDIEPGRGNY